MGSVRKEKFPKTKQAQWKSPPSVRSQGNWPETRFQWQIGWWMFHPPPQDPQSDKSRHSKDLHHLHKQHWNHSWARYQRRHKHHWWISVLKTANRNTGNGNSKIDDKAKSTQPRPANHGRMHRETWKPNKSNHGRHHVRKRKDWLSTFTQKTKLRLTWHAKDWWNWQIKRAQQSGEENRKWESWARENPRSVFTELARQQEMVKRYKFICLWKKTPYQSPRNLDVSRTTSLNHTRTELKSLSPKTSWRKSLTMNDHLVFTNHRSTKAQEP